MPTYNKLVRDRIPEIIERQGHSCVIRQLGPDAFGDALVDKLDEELAEYRESRAVEELADLVEVIRALVEHAGLTWEAFEAMRERKRAERGGFSQRWWLVATDE